MAGQPVRGVPAPPDVSIILPVYNAEAFLDEVGTTVHDRWRMVHVCWGYYEAPVHRLSSYPQFMGFLKSLLIFCLRILPFWIHHQLKITIGIDSQESGLET